MTADNMQPKSKMDDGPWLFYVMVKLYIVIKARCDFSGTVR